MSINEKTPAADILKFLVYLQRGVKEEEKNHDYSEIANWGCVSAETSFNVAYMSGVNSFYYFVLVKILINYTNTLMDKEVKDLFYFLSKS